MSFNHNQCLLVGRLTKDPEIKKAGETTISVMSLAIDRSFKKKDGTTETDFFNVKMFSKLAEVSHMLKKGMPVLISGRIQNNNYEKDGIKHFATEIIAETFQILQTKAQSEEMKPTMGEYKSVMQEPTGQLQESEFDFGNKTNAEGIPF